MIIDLLRPSHRGIEDVDWTCSVEPGGPPVRSPAHRAIGDDETGGTLDLAVEIAGIEVDAPDRLVHLLELRNGERLGAERGCQGGVLQLGTRALNPVDDDTTMVERQLR